MNAILAIAANGGRAIVVIYRVILYLTLRLRPHPTPCKEAPRARGCSSIKTKTMALEGGTAPSWWGCLCACV